MSTFRLKKLFSSQQINFRELTQKQNEATNKIKCGINHLLTRNSNYKISLDSDLDGGYSKIDKYIKDLTLILNNYPIQKQLELISNHFPVSLRSSKNKTLEFSGIDIMDSIYYFEFNDYYSISFKVNSSGKVELINFNEYD